MKSVSLKQPDLLYRIYKNVEGEKSIWHSVC